MDTSVPYLRLAKNLYKSDVFEKDLLQFTEKLPLLTQYLLDNLVDYAEHITLSRPKHSWAILAVAHQAAKTQNTAQRQLELPMNDN